MTTSPDFSVADVLAWARTKPADGSYTYADASNCALCQFLRDTGRAGSPSVDPDSYGDLSATDWHVRKPLPAGANDAALGRDEFGIPGRLTFGALVARLEALSPDQVIPPSEWTRLDAYMIDELVGREA